MGCILPICSQARQYKDHLFVMQTILHELGQRLRQLRSGAGLSIQALSQRAGVSRRTVGEIEAGRANPTLLRLSALADALDLPLGVLCDLQRRVPRERLALVGLRGAGKSTVGRALALALDAPFVQLDREVEELAGMPLAELFDLRGAPTYRRLEREALERVLERGGRLVLETGGSIVAAEDTFGRLRSACRTVWLRASPAEHLSRVMAQGDRRPTEGHPRAAEELEAILAERSPSYALCDDTVETSGASPDEVCSEILARLGP